MNTKELSPICRQVRRDIITMTANAGSGHPGGSLSAVELMTSVPGAGNGFSSSTNEKPRLL